MQLELIQLLSLREGGIFVIALYFVYQFVGSRLLPWETTLDKIINRVEDKIDGVEDQVEIVEERQKAHMQITKATTQVDNPRKELNHEEIDNYYEENGVTAEDFKLEKD